MDRKKIGYYDYTVILTYCGMLFAFTGILMAFNGLNWNAVICMMLAGVCDMFDGAVASTKDRDVYAKSFGIQIDSLSDLISFGVLPGVIVYSISNKTVISGVAAALYTLCALIRLAYYNVLEAERQKMETESRKAFLGVPVTTIAILLPVFYVLFSYGIIKHASWLCGLLLVVSIGFITPISIKKPQLAGKIALVALGIAEIIAMIFVFIWGLV